MDFSGHLSGIRHRPRPEINLVPFIDILLVLLVIFIVASPVLTHAVKLELPRVSSQVERHESKEIRISVLADGQFLFDGETTPADSLERRLLRRASASESPSVRIAADGRASYEAVARALAATSRAGIARIAFATVPERGR